MDDNDFADHAFLDGRLVLREPRRGHRSGTDAVLLAAATRLEAGQHLIDVGSGAGAAAFAVLSRVDGATATLVEQDRRMAALARHNAIVNGFADRVEVVDVDLFDLVGCRQRLQRPGDVVISNPPFYLAGTVREPDVAQRVSSHILAVADHGDWFRRALALAQPRGRIVVIHRPEVLPAIVEAARGRAALGLRAIHPWANKSASRMLVEGSLGRRTPFTIEPPLILHQKDGRFTDEAEALHRGSRTL